LWLAYGVIAFFAALAMPAVIYSVNKLFAWKFKIDLEKAANLEAPPRSPDVLKVYPDEEAGSPTKRPIQITIH
jgi:hypothetical protein